MVRYRSHSIEFKRQIAQEFLAGETLHGLEKRHDLSRNLIRVWVERYQAGAFDEDAAARLISFSNTKRGSRPSNGCGRQASAGIGGRKGGLRNALASEKRAYIRNCLPETVSVAEGCRLMEISRSAYYNAPTGAPD